MGLPAVGTFGTSAGRRCGLQKLSVFLTASPTSKRPSSQLQVLGAARISPIRSTWSGSFATPRRSCARCPKLISLILGTARFLVFTSKHSRSRMPMRPAFPLLSLHPLFAYDKPCSSIGQPERFLLSAPRSTGQMTAQQYRRSPLRSHLSTARADPLRPGVFAFASRLGAAVLSCYKADADRTGKPTFPYPRLHGACERCGIGWLTLCNASSAVARPFAGFPVG